MLDITRFIFIPSEESKEEASNRGTIKKYVDKCFTKEDKKKVLENRGLKGDELASELNKFVPESILSNNSCELISKTDISPVIESRSIALSYTDGMGSETPHWHPDEVETYLSYNPIQAAIRFIDRREKHEILDFQSGRFIFPPRVCHFTDLRGHTEVMSFRQQPRMQRIGCKDCHLFRDGDCQGLIISEDKIEGETALINLVTKRSTWLKNHRNE